MKWKVSPWFWTYLWCLGLLFVACTQNFKDPAPPVGSTPKPFITAQSINPAVPSTLINTYQYTTDTQPGVDGMAYWPKAAGLKPITLDLARTPGDRATLDAVPAAYAGWDVLAANSYQVPRSNRADATSFTLTRPARVALLLRTPARPAWLSGWTQGPDVTVTRYGQPKAWPTFEKQFQAGTVNLPGLADTSDLDRTYDVLLAEVGPLAPAVQANAPCPAWVHDQYTAIGPDGKPYPTWHPPVDPQYHCYFGHEHGSAPQAGDPAPLYGYTSTQGGMPAEMRAHGGFKGYAMNYGAGQLYITQHFGTGGLGRACTRMHTVDLSYVEAGQVRLNYHFMGDFGRGMATTQAQGTPITSCPQPSEAETQGVRDLKLGPDDGYEAWRVDLKMAAALGFKSAPTVPTTFTFRTHDPITYCQDAACTALGTFPNHDGSGHSVVFDNLINILPAQRGTFYTDAMGSAVVAKGTPGAVEQYIDPTLTFSFDNPNLCFGNDAWGGPLDCTPRPLTLPSKNIEGSLGPSN